MPYSLQEDSNDRQISSSSERLLSEEFNPKTSENPFMMVCDGFSVRVLGRSTTIHMVVGAERR
jgi:hypothetical protein